MMSKEEDPRKIIKGLLPRLNAEDRFIDQQAIVFASGVCVLDFFDIVHEMEEMLQSKVIKMTQGVSADYEAWTVSVVQTLWSPYLGWLESCSR